MTDFVIKGNICYSKTKNELETVENGYLVCKGGKSAGVYKALPKEYASLPITDYGRKLVIPGMVDLHTHAPQLAFRGMSMDLELLKWLESYTFPEEEKYGDLEYAGRAYPIFADTIKKSATTRAVIFATCHVDATMLLMELMDGTGVISYVGKVNMDRAASDKLREKSAEASALDTRRWLEAAQGKFSRTMPILTPRFIPCCTDGLMAELCNIREEYGLPVQSHLSENRDEVEWVRSLRPDNKFYGEAYDDYGFFGVSKASGAEVKTVMAHCVLSCGEEARLMQKNGVFIAHCPASNMNLSSGIAPIRKYLDMNIRVGLGTDIAGGQSESIFRAMTDAIQASKMYRIYVDGESSPITFPEAFYMATAGGGEFFGKVGSFCKGYELDALVLDDAPLASPRELTLAQRLERAVYLLADTSGITAKYVRGARIF